MTAAMSKLSDAELIELCISAFHSEHYERYDEAFEKHQQALLGLNNLVSDAGNPNWDRKRVAIKQIKFHTARLQVLIALRESGAQKLKVVLPTSISLQEDLVALQPHGVHCLSYEEIFLATQAKKPEARPPSNMMYLMQEFVPYFTFTLDPTLPATRYDIYHSESILDSKNKVYYLKAKSAEATGSQTLYVLQALKRRGQPIGEARLHRSTEFTKPCVQVIVGPVKIQRDPIRTSEKGRTMRFNTTSPRPVVETPDRFERKGWSNRRFSYGGRKFVWMTEGRNEASFGACWETESVRPKPGSKTGKKEHTVLPDKVCWGTTVGVQDVLRKKMGTIYMVGGLDQMFKECLLASQLAKFLVVVYGHTD